MNMQIFPKNLLDIIKKLFLFCRLAVKGGGRVLVEFIGNGHACRELLDVREIKGHWTLAMNWLKRTLFCVLVGGHDSAEDALFAWIDLPYEYDETVA